MNPPNSLNSPNSAKISSGMIEDLRARIAGVYERIGRAAQRSGRKPDDITLVAVSKTIDPASIQEAVDAGIVNLGENRVPGGPQKGWGAGRVPPLRAPGRAPLNQKSPATPLGYLISSIP